MIVGETLRLRRRKELSEHIVRCGRDSAGRDLIRSWRLKGDQVIDIGILKSHIAGLFLVRGVGKFLVADHQRN